MFLQHFDLLDLHRLVFSAILFALTPLFVQSFSYSEPNSESSFSRIHGIPDNHTILHVFAFLSVTFLSTLMSNSLYTSSAALFIARNALEGKII